MLSARIVLIISFIAAIQVACVDGRVTPKGVKVSLASKWPATPLLHEAAEFLVSNNTLLYNYSYMHHIYNNLAISLCLQADESSEAFWEFARGWKAPSVSGNASEAQCWASLTEQASVKLSPSMAQILKVSLALRQYSPRLEAFHQLAASTKGPSGACCWATVGDKVVNNPNDIASVVQMALKSKKEYQGALLPFDHVHQSAAWGNLLPNISDPTLIPAVLYGPIGSRCSVAMDASLRAAADKEPRVAYAWRPLLQQCAEQSTACAALGVGGPLTLHGYGVELAIKNMEYNARDDSKTPEAEKSSGASSPAPTEQSSAELDDGPEEVAGFNFAALVRRRPALRQEILTFRDHLLAAASQEQALKVWDLKDLGLQAAQRVVSASDPLHLLGEVAQNFPLLVEALSKSVVSEELRLASFTLTQKLPPGGQYMLINGVPYDLTNFNLYDFIDELRKEVRLMDALMGAGLPLSAAREAAILRGTEATPGGSDSTPRLDIRPDSESDEIVWVNDLEKDPMYRAMPRSLMGLLQPGFMGQVPSVRRNVFTALLAFDPATPQGLLAGNSADMMVQQGWPIRIGLMPVPFSKEGTPGHKTALLFAAVGAAHGGRAASDFLNHCASTLPPQDMVLEPEAFTKALLPIAKTIFKQSWDEWSETAQEGTVNVDFDLDSGNAALKAALDKSTALGQAAQQFLKSSSSLINSRGLSASVGSGGVVVFNGLVAELESQGSWRSVVGNAFQQELQAVAQDIYLGRLRDDSTDLYADILAKHNTVPRYNLRAVSTGARSRRTLQLNAAAEGDQAPRQVGLLSPYAGIEVLAALPVRYHGPNMDKGSTDDETSSSSSSSDQGYGDYDDQATGSGSGSSTSNNSKSNSANSSDKSAGAMVTHWVVVDATSPGALQLAADGLQHDSGVARVGILINPLKSSSELLPVEKLVTAAGGGLGAFSGASRADLIDLFADLATVDKPENLKLEDLTKKLPEGIGSASAAALLEPLGAEIAAVAAKHEALLRRGLSLGSGKSGVVTNGRVLELRYPGDIVEEDFQLLDFGASKNQFAGKALSRVLSAAVSAAELKDPRKFADGAAIISSLLTTYQPTDVNVNVKALLGLVDEYRSTPLLLASKSTLHTAGAPILIQAVLNPLSKITQQMGSVFAALRAVIDPDVEVLLNPKNDYSEMPMKTFYRFVVPDVSTPPTKPISAVFSTLPPHKTLTLGMDVPEGWLVEPIKAAHDLDNLRLEELSPGIRYAEAEFELEALMVAGMVVDAAAVGARNWDAVHPRGVQLQLGTVADPEQVDTLVMSNLGYYQLKAAPGVWALRLAPGRSQELYAISAASPAGTTNAVGAALVPAPQPTNPGAPVSVPVAVTGFGDRDILLVLRKDPEHLSEDVLDPDGTLSAAPTAWSKVTKIWKKDHNSAVDTVDNETIHVFTVASGHMYERLQKIMILSALKRTKNRLKFWFIKNYMSPAMKEFVPVMAKQYGFEYE